CRSHGVAYEQDDVLVAVEFEFLYANARRSRARLAAIGHYCLKRFYAYGVVPFFSRADAVFPKRPCLIQSGRVGIVVGSYFRRRQLRRDVAAVKEYFDG